MRLFKVMLFALALLPAWPALAGEPVQTDAQRAAMEAKMCAETKCQRNVHVVLRKEDGTLYDRTFGAAQATVHDNAFFIFAGQTIYIEADVADDDRLVNLVAVDAITAPKKTITAKLEQVDGKGMMLVVTNPFPKTLKFNMGMMPLMSDGLRRTSSCPVIPGGSIFESWPFPILQLIIANGRFLAPSDTQNCVN